MHASLARKASTPCLILRGFRLSRGEYSGLDKVYHHQVGQWRGQGGRVPLYYWILPPNAPAYNESIRGTAACRNIEEVITQ